MTNILCCFKTKNQSMAASAALFFIRLVAGSAFILHGWGKIQNPFSWMGESSPIPGIFQFLAAFSEFGGGIALILGLLTTLASLGIGCTMVVACHLHAIVLKDPFVNPTGGASYELAAVYLSIMLLLLTQGPGKISLDYQLFKTRD